MVVISNIIQSFLRNVETKRHRPQIARTCHLGPGLTTSLFIRFSALFVFRASSLP